LLLGRFVAQELVDVFGCYVLAGFSDDAAPFSRIGIVVWEMCASLVIDVIFEVLNPHIVFVAVWAVNFSTFYCFVQL